MPSFESCSQAYPADKSHILFTVGYLWAVILYVYFAPLLYSTCTLEMGYTGGSLLLALSKP